MKKISANGFTLLELLISLTILSIIVTIIFGAFHIGVRAWEKGENDIDSRQRSRIVIELIRSQVASICQRKVRDNGKRPFYLKGTDNSLEFLSMKQILPENKGGLIYVKYAVKSDENNTENLFVCEKNIVIVPSDPKNMPECSENDFHALLSGDIDFSYLKDMTEEWFQWQSSWQENSFPFAVSISFRQSQDAEPLTGIARIEKN